MNVTATLCWYLDNILDYFLQMTPCMLAALLLFFAFAPVRKRRLASQRLTSPPGREAALLLFTMFLTGLAALTIFPANFWSAAHFRAVLRGESALFPAVDWTLQEKTIQLVPGQEIRRAFRGPWVMFLMLANIGIFLPLGFFYGLLGRKTNWFRAILAGFALSGTIEFIQLFIGRSTDIDDIILNSFGTALGYGLFRLLRRAAPGAVAKFQCQDREDAQDGSLE
jgi:glycopeptide antibiotics resistance protein